MEDDLPVRLVVEWLTTRISGCGFARKFAKESRPASIALQTVHFASDQVDAIGGALHEILIQQARKHAAALFIFPDLREDEEIAALMVALSRHASFTLLEMAWPAGCARTDVLLRLQWATPSGHLSEAMGLAPSGLMPLTRRAPFVCLLIWPGAHENPYRPNHQWRTVGVVDMRFQMRQRPYNLLWKQTEAAKALRDAEEPTISASMRKVTFCLHQRVRDQIPAPMP